MSFATIPAEHLLALYDHFKSRRENYKTEAYKLLGGKCGICGSTASLRHRFINRDHPLANRYRTNPVTLYRRVCLEPELRATLCLLCRECRIAYRSATPLIADPEIPGHKTLDNTNDSEGIHGQ